VTRTWRKEPKVRVILVKELLLGIDQLMLVHRTIYLSDTVD